MSTSDAFVAIDPGSYSVRWAVGAGAPTQSTLAAAPVGCVRPAELLSGDGVEGPPANFVETSRHSIAWPMAALFSDGFWTCEDVTAQVLEHVRVSAIPVAGQPVDQAAVTCPADFGVTERVLLRRAARRAGFRRVELVDEPVAAALGLDRETGCAASRILVVDLGHRHSRISLLLRSHDGGFSVEQTQTCPFGLRDVDESVLKWAAARPDDSGEWISARDLSPAMRCRFRRAWQTEKHRLFANPDDEWALRIQADRDDNPPASDSGLWTFEVRRHELLRWMRQQIRLVCDQASLVLDSNPAAGTAMFVVGAVARATPPWTADIPPESAGASDGVNPAIQETVEVWRESQHNPVTVCIDGAHAPEAILRGTILHGHRVFHRLTTFARGRMTSRVSTIAVNRHGSSEDCLAAVGFGDGTALTLNRTGTAWKAAFESTSAVNHIAVYGDLVVAGIGDGRVVEHRNGEQSIHSLTDLTPCRSDDRAAVVSVTVVPPFHFLIADAHPESSGGFGSVLLTRTADTGTLGASWTSYTKSLKRRVLSGQVTVDAEGHFLGVLTEENRLRLWRIAGVQGHNLDLSLVFGWKCEFKDVRTIALSRDDQDPDGDRFNLFLGYTDGRIARHHVGRRRTGEYEVRQSLVLDHGGLRISSISHLRASSDGRYLIAASPSGAMCVWRIERHLKVVAAMPPGHDRLTAFDAVVVGTQAWLFAGFRDGTLTVWRPPLGPPREEREEEEIAPSEDVRQPGRTQDNGNVLRNAVDRLKAAGFPNSSLSAIGRLAAEMDELPRLAVIGAQNAGKSTLLNALLGDEGDIAVVDYHPTTAIGTLYRQPCAEDEPPAHLDQPFAWYENATAEHPEWRSVVDDLADFTGHRRFQDGARIEIPLEHDLLHIFTLLDTPGFDSRDSNHERVAARFRESAHATVHVIGSAEVETTDNRIRRMGESSVIVLNQIDKTYDLPAESEWDRLRDRQRELCEEWGATVVVPVSALLARYLQAISVLGRAPFRQLIESLRDVYDILQDDYSEMFHCKSSPIANDCRQRLPEQLRHAIATPQTVDSGTIVCELQQPTMAMIARFARCHDFDDRVVRDELRKASGMDELKTQLVAISRNADAEVLRRARTVLQAGLTIMDADGRDHPSQAVVEGVDRSALSGWQDCVTTIAQSEIQRHKSALSQLGLEPAVLDGIFNSHLGTDELTGIQSQLHHLRCANADPQLASPLAAVIDHCAVQLAARSNE